MVNLLHASILSLLSSTMGGPIGIPADIEYSVGPDIVPTEAKQKLLLQAKNYHDALETTDVIERGLRGVLLHRVNSGKTVPLSALCRLLAEPGAPGRRVVFCSSEPEPEVESHSAFRRPPCQPVAASCLPSPRQYPLRPAHAMVAPPRIGHCDGESTLARQTARWIRREAERIVARFWGATRHLARRFLAILRAALGSALHPHTTSRPAASRASAQFRAPMVGALTCTAPPACA